MEMELTSVCVHPSGVAKMALLFCLFWPFVAVSLMSGRGRSAAPVAAVLAPLAVSAAGAWIGLERVRWARAIVGGEAAAAAGVAEALSMFTVGASFALVVIAFAALRRHRPLVDRLTATLVAAFLADWIVVLFAGAAVVGRGAPRALLIAGAIVSGAVALIAVVWTVLTGRGRVSSAALPYGVAVAAIPIATLGVIVWQIAHRYIDRH